MTFRRKDEPDSEMEREPFLDGRYLVNFSSLNSPSLPEAHKLGEPGGRR